MVYKKRTKKQRLKSKADRLWFEGYLKGKCDACGLNYRLQGHHYFYKSTYGHLRYDKDNHITLCKGCHFVLHHRDPKKIEMKIIEKRGKRWYNRLTQKARTRPPSSYQTVRYYEQIIEELTKELSI